MIYILGTGPFARELQTYCWKAYPHINRGVNLVGDDGDLTIDAYTSMMNKSLYGCETFLGSGKPEIKLRMFSELVGHPADSLVLGHLSDFSSVGLGSVLAHGSVVSAYTKIGSHVLVNYAASIGHDCVIGDFATVGPNASISGGCHIGTGAYIGAGANIREGIKIGIKAVVGMGSVVTEDVADGVTVYGVPAKPKDRQGGWA